MTECCVLQEEELGTRVVMGRVTAPSDPCEKAPELVVHSR